MSKTLMCDGLELIKTLSYDLCAEGNHKGQLNNHMVTRKDFLQNEIYSNWRSVTGHFRTFTFCLLVRTGSVTFPFFASMLSML